MIKVHEFFFFPLLDPFITFSGIKPIICCCPPGSSFIEDFKSPWGLRSWICSKELHRFMQTSPDSLGRPEEAVRVMCQQTRVEKYILRQSCKANKTEGQSWRHYWKKSKWQFRPSSVWGLSCGIAKPTSGNQAGSWFEKCTLCYELHMVLKVHSLASKSVWLIYTQDWEQHGCSSNRTELGRKESNQENILLELHGGGDTGYY